MTGSRVLGCVVVLVVLAPLAGVATAAGPAALGASPVVPTHNGTNATHHEDPDSVEESGDLTAISSWLAGYLVDRLGNSTIQLSQGEYETARSLLGDDFGARVEQLVDVAGETDTAVDDRVATRLAATERRQREYVTLLAEYRETLAAYREARANGNEERARRLARELGRLADRLDSLGARLRADYRVLGNLTGEPLAESRDRIGAVTENVTSQVASVEDAVFVATRLSVSAPTTEISFRNPLALSGRLVTENGTALANRTVTVRVGGQSLVVETDAEGRFTTTYRPTTVGLDTDAVRVRYVPANQSVYLGSAATVPVSITQVTPTLAVTRVTDVVRFGDTLRITGRVAVDDRGARGVPVVVTVAGVPVGTAHTDPDGRFTLTTSLPATIPVGEQSVAANVALSGAALAAVNATGSTTVESTQSDVTVDATQGEGATVRVRGRVTGADTPVPGQVVTVEVGNRTVTATTDADGRFVTTVALQSVAPGDRRTVAVAATFEGAGTNLLGATAATTVTVARPPPTGGTDDLTARVVAGDLPPWLWALLGGGVLVALAGVGVLVRRRGGAPTTAPTPDTDDSADTDPGPTRLERAESLLADGDLEGAVRTGFAALRAGHGRADTSAHTHWEFYAAHAPDLDAADRAALEAVVETYERTVYAPESVTHAAAATALEQVAALLDATTG